MKVVVVHISSCTPSSKEMCGNIQPLYSKQSSYHSIHRKDTDEDERHITLCSYSLRSVHRKTLCDVWSKKEAPESGKYTVTSHTPSTINCKLARFELCVAHSSSVLVQQHTNRRRFPGGWWWAQSVGCHFTLQIFTSRCRWRCIYRLSSGLLVVAPCLLRSPLAIDSSPPVRDLVHLPEPVCHHS